MANAGKARNVSASEVAKFDAMAARWWDPEGPVRELHRMNPLRIGWIAERAERRFGAVGVRWLDVGCGAGLAAEAAARLGHVVTAVDEAAEVVAVAKTHAASEGLAVDYRVGGAEVLADSQFEIVTALEVIEHTADPDAFVRTLARRLAPGGLVFLSTINRTAASFVMAKLGAEYVLRFLPVGTHDWRMFVTPGELAGMMRRAGLRPGQMAGMRLDPLRGEWRIGPSLDVNYLAMASAAD